MKRITFTIAAFSALLAAQPAFAASVIVEYKDLDLGTEAGQQKLERRVDAAAKKVCGFDDIAVGSRIRSPEARECVAEARQKMYKRLALLTEKKVAGN